MRARRDLERLKRISGARRRGPLYFGAARTFLFGIVDLLSDDPQLALLLVKSIAIAGALLLVCFNFFVV